MCRSLGYMGSSFIMNFEAFQHPNQNMRCTWQLIHVHKAKTLKFLDSYPKNACHGGTFYRKIAGVNDRKHFRLNFLILEASENVWPKTKVVLFQLTLYLYQELLLLSLCISLNVSKSVNIFHL
jgi:hypothetical protein